jgi:hypothetical protein
MTVSQDGPAEIVALSCERTGPATVLFEIDDGNNILALSNAPMHIDTLVGSGLEPYTLPQAINIDELRKIRTTFTDLSGFPNAIRLAFNTYKPMVAVPDPNMKGARLRMSARQYLMSCYFYTTTGGPIVLANPGDSAEVAIDVDGERHFKLMQMSAVATTPAGVIDPTLTYTFDLVNGMTGESLFDAPAGQHYQIPNTLAFGTNNWPLRFKRGRLFERGQKMIVRVTNTSIASNTIWMTFAGQFIASRMWEA